MDANLRLAAAVAILGSTAIFIHARHRSEVIPQRSALALFPQQLGAWQGADLPISQDVIQTLGRGDFLSRTYNDQTSHQPVDLFMAYFPSQRTGDTIHSPENCLPGSGWSPRESGQVILSAPGHAPFHANRYLISKGEDRALVLYWYWAHDRAIASAYWAKFYLIADSLRWNRSDGALIRISTSFQPAESSDLAQQRISAFAAELVPVIKTYVPR